MVVFTRDSIRGNYPGDFDENRALALGAAVVAALGGGEWVVGRDENPASRSLHWLIARGVTQAGADAVDLGPCSEPMLTFAISSRKAAGGILITDCGDEKSTSGLRIWRKGVSAICATTGLEEIHRFWEANSAPTAATPGRICKQEVHPEYLGNLMKYADDLHPFSVMADLGCSVMASFLPGLFEKLPCELIDLADCRKPAESTEAATGMLPPASRRRYDAPEELSRAVRDSTADMGIVFSPAGGRCRLLAENGEPVPSAAIGGALAGFLLEREAGAKIVCGTRYWRPLARAVRRAGGIPVPAGCGRCAMGDVLRRENALFGCDGEGGYFFRDLQFSLNPELTLILLLSLLSREGGKLSELMRLRSSPSCVQEFCWEVEKFSSAAKGLEDTFSSAEAELLPAEGIAVCDEAWSFSFRPDPENSSRSQLLVEAESPALLAEKAALLNDFLTRYSIRNP